MAVSQLLPHWIAMFVVVMGILTASEALAPGLSTWIPIAVAVAAGLAYPSVVRSLGIAPEPWQRAEDGGE